MLSWLSRNKGKILILYAIKLALFFPNMAHAEQLFAEIFETSTTTTGASWCVNLNGNSWDANSFGEGYEGTYPDGTIVDETGNGSDTFDCLIENSGSKNPDTNRLWQYFGYSPTDDVNLWNEGDYWIKWSEAQDLYSLFHFDGIEWTTPQEGSECVSDPRTRILDFTPLDNSTTSSPVNFSLNACVNQDDLGTIKGVNITLHNIDQNVLLVSSFSPNDIELVDEDIETGGLYTFATTTTLGDGNYRIKACITRSYLGFAIGLFSPISDCQSHQFVVGEETFIGSISQRIWGDTNAILNGTGATSTQALANTCNPLGGNFDIIQCATFLTIPDSASLSQTMEDAREGILTRVPWGYFTRTVSILNNPATTTIQAWTASIQVGAGNDLTPEITTITIDPSDMLAGGASLLESVHDPITNKSPRDVFYPMVQLTIALSVIMTILADLAQSHNHANNQEGRKGKLS